jgi:hypothetical protein
VNKLSKGTSKPAIIIIVLALFILLLALTAFEPVILAQSEGNEKLQAPDFFIEAEVDNLTPYVGQQITYSLRRYQATEFPNQPHYEKHPLPGFWDIPLIQRPSYTTTLAGREYLVHPTHIALFPISAGSITIDPAKLIIPGDGPEADIVLPSEAINLQVQSLPAGAPRNFRGAVGQFEINAKFNTMESRADEVLSLIVEIKGNGNIETLLEPALPNLQHWSWPGTTRPQAQVTTNVPLSKDLVKGSRQFAWQVIPSQAGAQYFSAIRFSYFDPQTNTYRTISTDPIPITILPGENSSTFTGPLPGNKQEVRRLGGDIRHIKSVPVTLVKNGLAFRILGQPLTWSCIILPLLAIGGAWFWQSWQQRQLADTPQARRRRARRTARKILAATQQANADAYTIVRQALTGYLSDKLNQPITGLTTDRLIELLHEVRLNPQLTRRIRTLLAQIDASRFAPSSGEQSTTPPVIASARTLIDDLEEFFSKRGM